MRPAYARQPYMDTATSFFLLMQAVVCLVKVPSAFLVPGDLDTKIHAENVAAVRRASNVANGLRWARLSRIAA